ncbi:AAA family ATPase [Mogibacterium diversum]|uniref:AAA family ATPase n=1 Tax=Mogibacterium diversum TaxID=114527 RepID=UPI0026EEC25C|nr:AAA family ATPase [Mogibacterium diversum]
MDTRKIEKISAKGIIGLYDYNINFTDGNSELKAIYSENGCGKTNLLRLIHCVTSGSSVELQKIFSIPFKELEIKASGKRIFFTRRTNKSIDLNIYNESDESVFFKDLNPGDLKSMSDPELGDEIQDKYRDISLNVCNYTGNAVYLGTNRLNDVDLQASRIARIRWRMGRRNESGEEYDPVDLVIDSVLDELSNSLIRNAQRMTISSRGRRGVYSQIVKNIFNDSNNGDGVNSSTEARKSILEKIKEIDNLEYKNLVGEYELINFAEYNSIKNMVSNPPRVNAKQFLHLYPILMPYFDSLAEKIQDVSPAARLIGSFIGSINTMFRDKEIKYSMQRGFRVRSNIVSEEGKNEIYVDPSMLSSGEKHIIFLLAKVIISATRGDSLLIIDEPEISLGIQWQRLFVKYVQECAYESNLQVVMATHSPLILEDYDDIDVSVSKRESRD